MTWGRSSEETSRYFIPQCGEIFLEKNFWYYKGRRNHRQRCSISPAFMTEHDPDWIRTEFIQKIASRSDPREYRLDLYLKRCTRPYFWNIFFMAQIIQKVLDKNSPCVSCRVKTCLNATLVHFIYGTWLIKFRPSCLVYLNNISSQDPANKTRVQADVSPELPLDSHGLLQVGGETVFISQSLSEARSLFSFLLLCTGGLIIE